MENTQPPSQTPPNDTQQKGLVPFLKREWFQILILIAPFVIIPFVWNTLPERIPSHWNVRGEVNGYLGKFWGVTLLPLVNIGMALLLGLLPKIDPKRDIRAGMGVIHTLRLILTSFFLIFYILTLEVALGATIDFNFVTNLGLPILFLILGNYLPTVRPNYFVGIRVPWTLEDPENWRVTHKFAGKLWVVSSVISILLIFVLPRDIVHYFFEAYIAIITVPPIVFSYLFYRKSTKQIE